MLRTVRLLPLTGLSTLGFDTRRFPLMPPACYRASWQLPGPDSHRQATTSLRLTINHLTRSTSRLLDAQWQKMKMVVVRERWRLLARDLFPNATTALASLGGILALISSVVATLRQGLVSDRAPAVPDRPGTEGESR